MSIVAYVGLPRSGKSYTTVEQVILPALQKGRVVVTNIPLKKDALLRDFPRADVRDFPIAAVQADPNSIFDLVPHGAVCVIDELWRLWPAGKKVDQIPEAFKSFLAEHGHRVDAAGNAQHVVLVTQDLAQIAAFARQLVEQTFLTTKLTALGLSRKFRTDVYQGHPTGSAPPQQQRIRQIFGVYRPQIYQYYTSHTMSEAADGAVNEAAVDRRGNVLLRPLVMLAPVAVLALVVFGIYTLSHHRIGEGAAGGPVPSAAAGTLRMPGAAPVGSVVAAARWWVAGRLDGLCVGGRCGWALESDGRSSRWVALIGCRDLGMAWECPGPAGTWISEADAPSSAAVPSSPTRVSRGPPEPP